MTNIKDIENFYSNQLNVMILGLSSKVKNLEHCDAPLTIQELVSASNYGDVERLCPYKGNMAVLEMLCIMYQARNILWGKTVVELGALGTNYTTQIGTVASKFYEKYSTVGLDVHIRMTASMMYTACVAVLTSLGILEKSFNAILFSKNPSERLSGFGTNIVM